MSIESTIGKTYFDVLSVVKTKINNNLTEARGAGRIDLDDENFATVLRLIDASFSQVGPNGVAPLSRAVESYITENTTPVTPKGKKSKYKYSTK